VFAVNDWWASKLLQLNTGKTDIMWFGSTATPGRLRLSLGVRQVQLRMDGASSGRHL
jgi:hypothetical protein